FHVKTPSEARRLLDREPPLPPVETLPLAATRGRVAARPIAAPHDLPEFDRSVVDGYAVRAADTFGATPGLPAYLNVAGDVIMGQETELRLGPGQAARIATGGMLPEGADAVVMIEYTEALSEGTIEVTRPAAPGEHVVRRGDDVRAGAPLPLPIVPDQPERLRAALAEAIAASELVLISGGSSVGARDGTLDALLSFPDSELLLHGIAIRPGKPVIAVRIGERLLFGLPG